MSNESRREAAIVVAFAVVALCAASLFMLAPHRQGPPPVQAGSLPINTQPPSSETGSARASAKVETLCAEPDEDRVVDRDEIDEMECPLARPASGEHAGASGVSPDAGAAAQH